MSFDYEKCDCEFWCSNLFKDMIIEERWIDAYTLHGKVTIQRGSWAVGNTEHSTECEPQTKNNKQVKLEDEEVASTLTKKKKKYRGHYKLWAGCGSLWIFFTRFTISNYQKECVSFHAIFTFPIFCFFPFSFLCAFRMTLTIWTKAVPFKVIWKVA